jgi:hypothetical protein
MDILYFKSKKLICKVTCDFILEEIKCDKQHGNKKHQIYFGRDSREYEFQGKQ